MHCPGVPYHKTILYAGGLGLSALQLALAAGATAVGTAGSPPKRRFARGLGLQTMASSRSTEFASDLACALGEEGLPHALLNSLTSPGVCTDLTYHAIIP